MVAAGGFSLRKATLADLPILYEFEKGVIAAERPFDETLKNGEINYYDLQFLIESPDAELLVVDANNELVASGYVRIEKAKAFLRHQHYAYLGFMYVQPEFRGRQLNKMVGDGLTKWASSKGINEFRLEVYCDNISAIKAYEKIGFKKLLIEMRMNIA